jgi:hypothetical protein
MKIFTVIVAALISFTSFAQNIPASEIAAAKVFMANHVMKFNRGQTPVWVNNPKQLFERLTTKENVNASYGEFEFTGRISKMTEESFSYVGSARVGRKTKKPFRFYHIRIENGNTILTVVDGSGCK